VIFNKARKKCSRFLNSQDGRLKSHPSFTSLLQNNLFRETIFSLLHLDRKQENRDYRMESPFQHYSVGLRKFQKVGEEAVSKELKQLHMRETFTPLHSNDLSDSQKQKSLESLMFLNEKRDGTIKGRACADGQNQRETAVPGATTPPTVALESVLITATIGAYEERDVAIVDVPDAFFSADMDEEVIVTIRGR
jgi:hypothetical protein